MKNKILLLFLATASNGAFAFSCGYDATFQNSLTADADGTTQSVDVRDAKMKYKKGTKWKSKSLTSSLTLASGEEKEYEISVSDTMGFCYDSKVSFEWKCSSDSSYQSYTTYKEAPDSDRNTNFYIRFDGCDGDGDVTVTDDSSWF